MQNNEGEFDSKRGTLINQHHKKSTFSLNMFLQQVQEIPAGHCRTYMVDKKSAETVQFHPLIVNTANNGILDLKYFTF